MKLYKFFPLLFLVVLSSVQPVLCKTYYVKNNGDDNASGLSDSHAWRTLTKVNRFNFQSGDRILLKRGNVFSDEGLRLIGIDNLTVGDYGEGEKPHINGNAIQPIIIKNLKNITVKNINISGQEWRNSKAVNLHIQNVKNINLNGIYGDGFKGAKNNTGKTAILIKDSSGQIEIKNCTITNWGPKDLPKKTKDLMGIALIRIKSGNYSVHDNKIDNVNADCLHIYHCDAEGQVYNNSLSNAGEDSIDIKGSKNLEVHNNEFFRSEKFKGEGGSGSGGIPTYVVIHGAKGVGSKNIIIRNNNFSDGDCAAIKISKAENTDIFENKISRTKSAVYILNNSINTLIHNNIILDPQKRAGYKAMDGGCIYENNSSEGTKIYNNNIYNRKGSCMMLISIACCNGTEIYNNAVYNENKMENGYSLFYWPCGREPVIRGNSWYNLLNSNVIYFKGKIYRQNMQSAWQAKHPGDSFYVYQP